MVNVNSLKDVYPAVKEIISLLKEDKTQKRLSEILSHRMFHVSWTSSSELYIEIATLLHESMSNKNNFSPEIIIQAEKIIKVINESY